MMRSSSTPDPTKDCHLCGNSYSHGNYDIHGSTSDALDNRCKNCCNGQKKQRSTSEQSRELDVDSPDLKYESWQCGKYAGRVYKDTGRNSWTARVNNHSKNFNPKHYESDEAAYEAANLWRKQTSDELKLTKNKYMIINVENIPTYIIVQISQGYVTLLNFDMLDFVRQHTLSAGKYGRDNPKSYVEYYDQDDRKMKPLHRIIIGSENPVRISDCLLDNRRTNFLLPTDNKSSLALLKSILKLQYLEIMTQYANEFKWNDEDPKENTQKSKLLKESGIKLNRGLINQTTKEEIYQKYLTTVNSDYQGIPELMRKPGEHIHIIEDNSQMYKFCPPEGYEYRQGCSSWKQTTEFYEDENTWDGYSRICKSCK